MRTGHLKRETDLARRAMKRSDRTVRRRTPAENERWNSQRRDYCAVSGERVPPEVPLHHVLTEQRVRRAGGDVNDPRNSLTISPEVHSKHHAGFPRIPLSKLRPENFEFANELLGPGPAINYFQRQYA